VLVQAGAPKQRVMEQPKAAVVKAAALPEGQRTAVAQALQVEKKIKTAERKAREAREQAATEDAEQSPVTASLEQEPPTVELAYA